MTIEEAVKELDSYRHLRGYISLQEERIELLETVIEHGSSDIIKMDKKGGAGVMEKLAKLADLKAKRDELYVRLCKQEAVIVESIASLQDVRYSLLLELYYLKGEKLEQVCVDMNYSYRQIRRFKKSAIECYRVMRSCF